MANKYEIMSQAYHSIDAQAVQTFTGNDDEEIWAANNYERIKQAELANHNWNFNITVVALSKTVNTPLDQNWTYEYLPPSDALRFVTMMDTGGTQVEWEDATGRVYTNTDGVICKYQRDIDENDFPIYFQDLLISRLANEAAEALSGEDRMIERKYGEYIEKRKIARRVDGQNSSVRSFITGRNSPILSARHGGSNW